MPDAAFARAKPSPNVEDRRDEYTELERLMMAVGIMNPQHPDETMRKQYNLGPGEWLDYGDPEVMPQLTPMGRDAGGADLDNQIQFSRLLGKK